MSAAMMAMMAALVRAVRRLWLRFQIGNHEHAAMLMAEHRESMDESKKFIAAELAVLRRRLQIMVLEDVNLKTRAAVRKIAR